MHQKLQGKIAVVTGGNSGIGLGTAKRFAAEGATVFITGRRKAELDAAVAEIGHGAIAVQADSSSLSDLDRLYGQIREKVGRIDVLFVNAGGGSFVPLTELTEDHYNDVFGRNVKGVIFTVQKALPLLSKGASIILNGSNTSIKGNVGLSVYAASKAAVRSLARSWTLEFKGMGIRVNVIAPGPTLTPGLLGLAGPDEEKRKELLSFLASRVPLGRVAEVEEIAAVATFLASGESSYVAGIELFADGGEAQV